MDLILWRHAEAEEGSPDLSRPLTTKGEKQARRMAEWLHAHLPESTRIFASPARRTQQTVHALTELSGRKVKTLPELAPGASAHQLLALVDWPQARIPVLIVGHQPTLGEVVGKLLASESAQWAVKKGAVWWLQSRQREQEEQVVLRAVVNPDLI